MRKHSRSRCPPHDAGFPDMLAITDLAQVHNKRTDLQYTHQIFSQVYERKQMPTSLEQLPDLIEENVGSH